jgi:formylglycine-generating enzyme required for sulfatase activity
MTFTTAPSCIGITTAAASTFATTNIAGHAMVAIPGGHTVIGTSVFEDARSHWVLLSPYLIGETPTSELGYREVMGRPGRKGAPENHPVTIVSHDDAISYLNKRGMGLILPTEAQWENAARGPAVNIPKLMEEETGRFTPDDVVDFIDGRFENLVFGVLGEIFTDPKAEIFQKLMREGRHFFGWRVYGTRSGRLSREEVWFDREGPAPVDWGPKGPYGTYNMTGNVYEWVQDWYAENAYMLGGVNPAGPDKGKFRILRGGSWANSYPESLRAADRFYSLPDDRGVNFGFRPVVAPQDSKK